VDSSPSPVAYGLPPVLQSGTIAKVYVKDGQEVKKGDPTKGIPADKLYEFDAAIQKRDLDLAKTAVEQARNELDKANEAKKQHKKKIEGMEEYVKAARTKVTTAGQLYRLIEQNLKESYTAQGVDKALWPQKLANNPDLFKANADYADALAARDRLEAELDMLKAANVDLVVKQAEIGIKQAEEQQAKAQTAVDLCTLWAKSDGTVEQVKITEGSTLGISTRDPALWLVPSGPRIVWAEVEAEFAHRVTNELIDQEVLIADHTNPKLTYKGKVLKIGGTFLPKRSPEGILGNDTRILPVRIEVLDPEPVGKPPLRVGQRVRVHLGQ
ncbi:MAG TPA: HlyD family efflux transporter periplasmic adaptor subunit, partial [Gemmata sp.]|nr:HlyD family efflux transporter periplasmic adaptor subunit [Gemmata sp.]